MSIVKDEAIYTAEYIENLPDGERAELIDGRIYHMDMPTRTHQEILVFLLVEIGNYIKYKSNSCEVIQIPFVIYLNNDNKTCVVPDISVICDKSKLEEKGCMGSPDWIIEIVIPSSVRLDYHIKLFKYHTAGVREYWIVDPLKKRVTVYNFETETMEEYSFNDVVKVGIYEDLEIDFSKITL